MTKLWLLIAIPCLSGCHRQEIKPADKTVATEQVLRAHRLELTDDAGNVRAIVGFHEGASQPEVTLLDQRGSEAVTLGMDRRGQATLYFSDPNGPHGNTIYGRVGVGYLWGSDCCYKPGEYDPLGSWGVRILKKDREGYLSSYKLFLADPNELDPGRFASTGKVSPQTNAHRR